MMKFLINIMGVFHPRKFCIFQPGLNFSVTNVSRVVSVHTKLNLLNQDSSIFVQDIELRNLAPLNPDEQFCNTHFTNSTHTPR